MAEFNWKDYIDDPAVMKLCLNDEILMAELDASDLTRAQKKEAYELINKEMRMSQANQTAIKRYRTLEKRNKELYEAYQKAPNKKKADQIAKEFNENRAKMTELYAACEYFNNEHKKVIGKAQMYDNMITESLTRLGKLDVSRGTRNRTVSQRSVNRRKKNEEAMNQNIETVVKTNSR